MTVDTTPGVAELLEFERAWPAAGGWKADAIRRRFGLTAARYQQLLRAAIATRAALEHDPVTARQAATRAETTRQRRQGLMRAGPRARRLPHAATEPTRPTPEQKESSMRNLDQPIERPKTPLKGDPVNHPQHYLLAPGVEVIAVTEQLDFLRGNTVKYIARAGRKNPATEREDLQKARWYLDRALQKLELEQPSPSTSAVRAQPTEQE